MRGCATEKRKKEDAAMFEWGIIFLIIAVAAAFFGFRSLAGTAATAAKIVFVVGLVLFIVSLLFGRVTL